MHTSNFTSRHLSTSTHMHAVCLREEDDGRAMLWQVTLYTAHHEALFEVASRTIDDSEYMEVRTHLMGKGMDKRMDQYLEDTNSKRKDMIMGLLTLFVMGFVGTVAAILVN